MILPTPSSLPDWYTVLKDFASPLVTAIGILVAWRGLTTWRRQLAGGYEYETTRKLLRAMSEWEFELHKFRHLTRAGFVSRAIASGLPEEKAHAAKEIEKLLV